MGILEEIKERLELITLGELPYRDTDAEKIAMYREQEATIEAIEAAARFLRYRIATERKSLMEIEKPKKKKDVKPLLPKVEEFFRRLKKGTDWGIDFKFRWISDDERFIIWTIPGHLYWNGIGFPRSYATTRHTLSDLSKMPNEPVMESGLILSRLCMVREFEGRLTHRMLEDIIESAHRAARS